MKPMNRRLTGTIVSTALLGILAGCARTDIVIKPDYDFQKIRRVALLGFEDFPQMPKSGRAVASLFEKALLKANYHVVERRRIDEILDEHSLEISGAVNPDTAKEIGLLLGVDALIFGDITTYTPQKKNLILVDIREVKKVPIIEKEEKKIKKGDEWITIEEDVVKGYTITRKVYQVPQTYTMEAEVGLAVRMVDVQTGELLWVGSSFEEALNVQVAIDILANRIMNGVKSTWPKQTRK